MSALEWILIYSTVPITFHIITNTDSISYVERIFTKVNATANCHFNYEVTTLASLMDLTSTSICPKMTVSCFILPFLCSTFNVLTRTAISWARNSSDDERAGTCNQNKG